jgi:hypothetical protein
MHPRMQGYSKMIYWRYIRDIVSFSVKSRLMPGHGRARIKAT